MPAATAEVAGPLLRRITVAAAVAMLAGPGLAEEMTMRRAIEAASLHEGPLDMVAYYVAAPGGALEVTATFAPREAPATASMRIVMALGDGDDVAFAMPGYPEALYGFARDGGAVTVSVREVPPASDVRPGASGRAGQPMKSAIASGSSIVEAMRPSE